MGVFWKPPEGSGRAPRDPREPSEGSWESLSLAPKGPTHFCALCAFGGLVGSGAVLGVSLGGLLRGSAGVLSRSGGAPWGSGGDLGRSWTVFKTWRKTGRRQETRQSVFAGDAVPRSLVRRNHLQRGHQRVREGPKATTGAASVARDAAPRPLTRCDHIQRGHQCARVVSAAAASAAVVAGCAASRPRAAKAPVITLRSTSCLPTIP